MLPATDPSSTRAAQSRVPRDAASLVEAYRAVRRFTTELSAPLSPEDCAIQSMPDVSPTRWHLAHTTWFFETFLLARFAGAYRPFHPAFHVLFNSYYNTVGDQFPRPRRGLLSRPSLQEVYDYRTSVDAEIQRLLTTAPAAALDQIAPLLEIGIHHEQQHQELILTDIKHVFSCNPLCPAYREAEPDRGAPAPLKLTWFSYPQGLYEIGHEGDGFAYDNESPRHTTYLGSFQLASRLATAGEYLAFVEDHGYERPELWLSDGWATVCQDRWQAPLHWVHREEGWHQFTLAGLRPLDPAEPVCHVSYYEADAFARWAGARLPKEAEWEVVAEGAAVAGNFVESGPLHPRAAVEEDQPAHDASAPRQMFGDVWEWTESPYVGYPGYRPQEGALGEYNGKFMCNQYVLRGGSCATSVSHIRPTYRNFFPPHARWQFSGIRLAH